MVPHSSATVDCGATWAAAMPCAKGANQCAHLLDGLSQGILQLQDIFEIEAEARPFLTHIRLRQSVAEEFERVGTSIADVTIFRWNTIRHSPKKQLASRTDG